MSILRVLVERVVLLVFGLARVAFVMQGVACGCALVAAFVFTSADARGWLRSVLISILLLSGTYFIAGILMGIARRWRVHASGGTAPVWQWRIVLAISLLAFTGYAAVVSADLPPLWNQIAVHLNAIGFWNEWARGGSNAGLLLIPLFLSLFVPAQVTAAAIFTIAFPLALLLLLVTRSRLFPTLLAMGAICQTALVLSGWLASDAFAKLSEQALSSMVASGDAEVLGLAGELERATGILTRTATALAVPLFGTLFWFAFLRQSGSAAGYFTEGAALAPVAATPIAAYPAVAESQRTPAAPPLHLTPPLPRVPPPRHLVPPRHLGVALAVPGALMLLLAAADWLRARPSFVSSRPSPGEMIGQPPATVRISLDAALDPASTMYLTRLGDPASPVARAVKIVTRLAPDDPRRRTIEALPETLSAGLYHVRWMALPAGGGVARHGSFSFGFGVSVPADTRGVTHSLQDRDSGERGRRHAVAGGVLLLLVGVLLRHKY